MGLLEISVLLDNIGTVFNCAKTFYNRNKILYKCLGFPTNDRMIHTGKENVKINY